MAHIESTTEVAVPVSMAYNQWTQFEKFPLFMEGVKEVRQIDDKTLHWRAEIGGKDVEWDAAITHEEPYKRLSWRVTGDPCNEGSVTFQPAGASKTRITLRLEYEPEGAVDKTGSVPGVVAARIEGDLRRFKNYVEEQKQADLPPAE